MNVGRGVGILVVAAAISVLLLSGLFARQARAAVPFTPDDVLAGRNSTINHFDNQGNLLDTLDTSSSYITGMCFDPQGNLLTTDWSADLVSKFSTSGVLLQKAWYTPPVNSRPESCVRNKAGHYLVGLSGLTTNNLLELDANGVLVTTRTIAPDSNGADWIDLATDQCTLYYTSEGTKVKRFNVCTNTQLADFASIPGVTGSDCWGMHLRPNGEVITACRAAGVKRLSSTGTVLQTYNTGTAPSVVSLDGDGTSVWVGDDADHTVKRVDIASGTVLKQFTAPAGPSHLFGLAVVGEQSAALAVVAAPPSPSPSPAPALPKAGAPVTSLPAEWIALSAALLVGALVLLGVLRARRI
jgi:hypothetical protein